MKNCVFIFTLLFSALAGAQSKESKVADYDLNKAYKETLSSISKNALNQKDRDHLTAIVKTSQRTWLKSAESDCQTYSALVLYKTDNIDGGHNNFLIPDLLEGCMTDLSISRTKYLKSLVIENGITESDE